MNRMADRGRAFLAGLEKPVRDGVRERGLRRDPRLVGRDVLRVRRKHRGQLEQRRHLRNEHQVRPGDSQDDRH